MLDSKKSELTRVFNKYGYEDMNKPIAESLGIKIRDDSYPQNVRRTDLYYFFARDLGMGYRQPFKEKLIIKVVTPQYRTIKKGYEGIRTPFHPDGKWIW